MLEQIWVIPAITFVSFWLILFFGRRLRFGGSEIGLLAVGVCLLLSTVAGYQWITHESGPVEQPSVVMSWHWWEEQKNSDAALKAFFTTRTGDIGFLVGMSILFFAAGHTFDIATINARALHGDITHTALLWGAVALLVAVIGKSAQFPLHTW